MLWLADDPFWESWHANIHSVACMSVYLKKITETAVPSNSQTKLFSIVFYAGKEHEASVLSSHWKSLSNRKPSCHTVTGDGLPCLFFGKRQ